MLVIWLIAYILERKSRKPQFSLLDDDTIYEMLNLSRNHIPTLASIMNFGIYPQGLFPQLCITAISVPGYEIGDISTADERFTDNKRIEGTLSEMLDAALIFCRNNMKTGTFIDPQTGKRTDRTEYPVKAIREAVLNALIHRDYSVHTEGTPIQINFFKDRLEIHSPGNLYGRMTVEQLGHARPDLRNPALATMAENLLQAENRYSGIPTIRREMKSSGLPEPVFENRRNEFVVTLYNRTEYNPPQDSPAVSHKAGKPSENPDSGQTTHADASDRMKVLLEYCRTPRSRKEIADFLNIKTVFKKHHREGIKNARRISQNPCGGHPYQQNFMIYFTLFTSLQQVFPSSVNFLLECLDEIFIFLLEEVFEAALFYQPVFDGQLLPGCIVQYPFAFDNFK